MGIKERITEIIDKIHYEYNDRYECVECDEQSKQDAIDDLIKLFVFKDKPDAEFKDFKPVFLVNKKEGSMVLAIEPSEDRAKKQMGYSEGLKIVYLGHHEIKSILNIQGII